MRATFLQWVFLFLSLISQCIGHNHTNKLIYILLDGFRYDYSVDQTPDKIPGFTKFISEGVRAQWMNGVYPTLSYPSWTSLVTGLYPETHGIVGNYFYDPNDQDVFSLFDAESTGKKKWWNYEPIWTTATKNNIRTAVYLFGRCDIPFDDVTPEVCEHFVKIPGKEIFRTNVDKALKSLDEGFQFIGIYTEHVDTTGHAKGPESEERKQAVRELDETLLYLQEQLEARNMTDEVNIVIVSDHGMQDTTSETTKKIDLDTYLDPTMVENIADKGAFINIKVSQENLDKVFTDLSKIPDVDVYKKKDIPEELNYQNNKYIHEIIVKSKIGTWIRASKDNEKQLPNRNDDFVYFGGHGYGPDEEKMKAVFLAKGPDFKQNVKIPSIDLVDVYPLLTTLLEIAPEPHNGTIESLIPGLAHYTADAPSLTVSSKLGSLTLMFVLYNIFRY